MQRELWEYRSIYLAPLIVAGVTLLGFLIASIGRALATQDLALRREVLEEPYNFSSLVVMLTTFLVAVFYSLDTLYGERRDRSILFWKSLPVSDVTTVLVKAAVPVAIIPVLTFVITIAMQFMMLLLSTAVLAGSGLDAGHLWAHTLRMWVVLLYHLVAIHGLWYAPIFGWLLLVSAWARRAPFLWAFVPPIAIGVLERVAFGTTHFASIMGRRVSGGPESANFGGGPMAMRLAPGQFLLSPGLWIGLLLFGAFLAAAVWLRRNREPL